MTRLLFALLYLSHLVRGASTDATILSTCLPINGATRSVWRILGSCALTLLVCAWHTIHFPVPQNKWQGALSFNGLCFLGFLFAPEVMMAYAGQELWIAYEKVENFRAKGYQWSMTHSFFGQMGGFVYRNEKGEVNPIDCDGFLELCEQNKVANPHLTAKEIKDKSKSDLPGKAILAIQLIWFILEDIIRGSRNIAVSLIELDTICMAVVSLIAMFVWRHKPLRPECPHVFYATQAVKQEKSGQDVESPLSPLPKSISAEDKKALSDAWKPESIFPDWVLACSHPIHNPGDAETGSKAPEGTPARPESRKVGDKIDKEFVTMLSLCATWMILGGLHLIAWDFTFPTVTERTIWRVVSLVLTAGPLPFLGILVIIDDIPWATRWRKDVSAVIMVLAGILGFACRAILLGLTLASLRALPCSAHQVIAWTLNIPHL